MADDIRRAVETAPPTVEDLARNLDLSRPGPIMLGVNERYFCLPHGTRYIRFGPTQEGLLVEYLAEDGAWESAEEVSDG